MDDYNKDMHEGTHKSDEETMGGSEGNETSYTGVCLSIGAGLGVSFGVIFDNLTMGISLGTALGLIIGAVVDAAKKKK